MSKKEIEPERDGILLEIALAYAEGLRKAQEVALEREREAKGGAAPKKPTLKKDQEELIKAISGKDLEHLKDVLGRENFSPSALCRERSEWVSPLYLATRRGWPEGVRALLAAGAREPDSLFQDQGEEGRERRALARSVSDGSAEIFGMLLEAEEDPKVRERACQAALESSAPCLAKALDLLGEAALPPGADPFDPESAHMDLWGWHDGHEAAVAHCVKRLLELRPEGAKQPETARKLWTIALESDDPSLAAALAAAGCPPAPDRAGLSAWEAESDADALEALGGAGPMSADMLPGKLRQKKEARIAPSVLALAAWSEAPKVLKLLIGSPALKEATMGSADSVSLLAACRSVEILKILKEEGFALEGLRDDADGQNPLHRMARAGEGKARLVSALTLCPAWGLQESSRGGVPAMLCENEKARAGLEASMARKSAPRASRAAAKKPRRSL